MQIEISSTRSWVWRRPGETSCYRSCNSTKRWAAAGNNKFCGRAMAEDTLLASRKGATSPLMESTQPQLLGSSPDEMFPLLTVTQQARVLERGRILKDGDESVPASTVVIATGAQYRKLPVKNLA